MGVTPMIQVPPRLARKGTMCQGSSGLDFWANLLAKSAKNFMSRGVKRWSGIRSFGQ